jgi:glucosamine-6-phosphate deaminase
VLPDEVAIARGLADRVAAALQANPRLVLGLPTGRTPVGFYAELSSRAARKLVDLSQVTTFNLDEFVGIPASHPGSFRTFMNTHLFSRVHLAPDRIHFLDGQAADFEQECERYEREIAAAGGIDLQILGLGSNGHIGFNEPGAALVARTHHVALEAETRRDNAGLFRGDPEAVPSEALSMGIATILQARKILLVARGAAKADIVARVVRGPVTTEIPGSFLQLHPDVEIVLDPDAASNLGKS